MTWLLTSLWFWALLYVLVGVGVGRAVFARAYAAYGTADPEEITQGVVGGFFLAAGACGSRFVLPGQVGRSVGRAVVDGPGT